MNVLFDLPESQQIALYTQWLELSSLNRLDDALCCRKLRNHYLDLVRAPHCILPRIEVGFSTRHSQWALRRGLAFQCAVLYASLLVDDILCTSFFACCGSSLQQLHLAAEYGPSGDDFCDLSPLWTIITDLIGRHCPRLKELRVSSDLDKIVHNEAALTTLLTSCTQLTTLKLENSKLLGDWLLEAIVKAPNLQTVDLSGSYIHLNSFANPVRAESSTVTELRLNQARIVTNNIHTLYWAFPNLRRTQCTNLESADLVCISALCPLLTHINVSVVETTYEDTVLMLADNWKCIESVTIHYPPGRVCTESAILAFITHCPTLTKLDVFSSGEEVINRYNWLQREQCVYPTDYKGSRLRELYVHFMFENLLRAVLQWCPYLYVLAIHHGVPLNVSVTNSSHTAHITPAEQSLHLINNSNIRVLYIHNYNGLDDDHIKHLSNLHELYLSNVDARLTSGGISALCRRCPNLRALYIKSCVQVTDSFVLPLLTTHPSLQLLEFYSRGTRYADNSPAAGMLRDLVKNVYPNMKRFEINYRPL